MNLLVDGQAVPVLAVVALGLGVGFLAGLFGVGGGFLLTPLLHSLLRVPLEIAVGSGLCQMIGTATTALLRPRRLRQGELRIDLLMLGGTLIGVDAGTRLMDLLGRLGDWRLAGHPVSAFRLVLLAVYALLLGAIGLQMLREGRRVAQCGASDDLARGGPLARLRIPPLICLPDAGLPEVSAPVLAYLGLGLGLLSGLLGIGGGVALMPVLIYGIGLPIRTAAGTGILVLAATAIFGTAVHALRGHVNLELASLLLLGSTVGAQLGARATSRWPVGRLKAGFAGVVFATMAVVLWELVRLLLG
jgi:uncharacterized membrane protein YfcA